MMSAWRNCKNIFSRPLFTIIFRPEMLKFRPYSISTGQTMVRFVIYCVLRQMGGKIKIFLSTFLDIKNNIAPLLDPIIDIYVKQIIETNLKLEGSLRKVICNCSKNLFIPVSKDWGAQAFVLILGVPSNTITRSAKQVAMMKSCSTMKPEKSEMITVKIVNKNITQLKVISRLKKKPSF